MSIFVCSRSISIFKLSCKSNFALANRSKALFSRAHYYNFTSQHLIAKFPQKWQPFLKLMRADKPIGIWLLYWPCTWSIGMASVQGSLPDSKLLMMFAVGAFLMRSSGCIINDLLDKDIDVRVERTRLRPLAAGTISDYQAITLLGSLLSLSLIILLQFNWTSIFLGASSMLLVSTYPLAKRYTYWPQAVLGLTFNWGALLGYTAATGSFVPEICLPLYIAGFFWTMIYDTIYAHQDKSDDILIGVHSTALKFGQMTKPWLNGFALLMFTNLAAAGYFSQQDWVYYVAISGVLARLVWQITTLRMDDPSDCWNKFKSSHWIGAIIFMGILLERIRYYEYTDC